MIYFFAFYIPVSHGDSGSISKSSEAAQYADIRKKIESELDIPHNGTMPFACHNAKNTNLKALKHFIRGCNLVGMYDPHDNMTSTGLSSEEMLRGLDRAERELTAALKIDPLFSRAKKLLQHCQAAKKSDYFGADNKLK
jgi:hypothetical protein